MTVDYLVDHWPVAVMVTLVFCGGLGLLVWGVWGDRARGRRRCPRCWYDMSGTDGRRCAECGREARCGRDLVRSRRRWSAAVPGSVMVSAAMLVALFGPGIDRDGWGSVLPTWALIVALPRAVDEEDAIVEALNERIVHRRRRWDNRTFLVGPHVRRLLADRCGAVARDHPSPGLRRYAIEVLRDLDDEAAPAVDDLIAILDDPDPKMVTAATYTLASIGPGARAAVPALARLVEDDSMRCAEAAMHALAEIGPDAAGAVPALRARLRSGAWAETAAWTLARIGPAAKPALPDMAACVRSAPPLAASKVAHAMARLRLDGADPAVVDALVDAVDDERAALRVAAAAALRTDAGAAEHAAVALASRIDGMSGVPCMYAIFGVESMGADGAPAVEALVRVLRHEDDGLIRLVAVRALDAIGPGARAALPALRGAADDPDHEVRALAAKVATRLEGLASAEP